MGSGLHGRDWGPAGWRLSKQPPAFSTGKECLSQGPPRGVEVWALMPVLLSGRFCGDGAAPQPQSRRLFISRPLSLLQSTHSRLPAVRQVSPITNSVINTSCPVFQLPYERGQPTDPIQTVGSCFLTKLLSRTTGTFVSQFSYLNTKNIKAAHNSESVRAQHPFLAVMNQKGAGKSCLFAQ